MSSSEPQRSASPPQHGGPREGWQQRLYIIIFEADTRAGRWFDFTLIAMIVASVVVVILDSIEPVRAKYGELFNLLEWFFTAMFTIEYVARLACVRHPMRYATSTFGIIDLAALLPTYLAVMVPGLHALIDVRLLRLLRLFRLLRLGAYVAEYAALGRALRASRRKIFVFMVFVSMVVTIMGTLMYVVEGADNGFTSIPVGIYWAITTMTTVGFGDITPKTDLGRVIASAMMLLGWGTLAVPTGIVSAEFTSMRMGGVPPTTRTCPECLSVGHLPNARFCRDCGAKLPRWQHDETTQG